MTGGAADALPLARTGTLVAAYAGLLVAWGNASSTFLGASAVLPGGSGPYAISGVALAAVSLASARALRLDAADLGLRGRALRGAMTGLALGGVAALVGVVALRLLAPLVVGQAVDYAPLARVAAPELLWHVALLLPLGIVLPEELAFRGVLLGAIARGRGARSAVVLSSLLFALWHGTVVFATVADTSLGPLSIWSSVATAGAFGVVAAGGAVLAVLRLRTGTLAATIAAHWTFNVVVLVGLWWTR